MILVLGILNEKSVHIRLDVLKMGMTWTKGLEHVFMDEI